MTSDELGDANEDDDDIGGGVDFLASDRCIHLDMSVCGLYSADDLPSPCVCIVVDLYAEFGFYTGWCTCVELLGGCFQKYKGVCGWSFERWNS